MDSGNLFLSFWHLCLDNLPEGSFRRRRIAAGEAKRGIERARKENALLCLSDDDLLAPYRERERDNHKSLCGVLAEHFGIELSLKDFFSKGGGDDAYYSVNPLGCVRVRGDNRLLIVTCSYVMSGKERGAMPALKLEPSTVEFHLIESIESLADCG